MIGTVKRVTALSALLVMALGVSASAGPPDTTVTGQHGAPVARQHVTAISPSAPQLQLERDRTALITRIQQGIDKANTDIDSLNRMADASKGVARDHLRHIEKVLTCTRDLLSEDREKALSATADDWNELRALVDSDLAGNNGEVRIAMAVVKTQPLTGVTNKQPMTK